MSDLSQIPTEDLIRMLQQAAPPPPGPQVHYKGKSYDAHKMIQDAMKPAVDVSHAGYKTGAAVNDFANAHPGIIQNLAGSVPLVGPMLRAGAQAYPQETAAGLGYGANVGLQSIPALFGGKVAQEAAAPALQDAGRSLMQSAVKPTLEQLRSGDAAKAINTMLEQGYSPTSSGVQAMRSKIADLSDEVSQAIANSPATVNKGAVASRLQDALARFQNQVNPQADTAAVEKALNEFLSHPLLTGKSEMPVQLAQALKQGTYQQLGSKPYGELSGASTEAQKQLARGLREEISKAVPGVAGLNAKQAELINAADVAERRALMAPNVNPISLGFLAQNPKAAAGFVAEKTPWFKALLARALYSGAKPLTYGAGAAAGGVIGSQMGQPE